MGMEALLRAFWTTPRVLHIVVAWTKLLVAKCTWRHTQTFTAAKVTVEYARFVLGRFGASVCACCRTICRTKTIENSMGYRAQ
eukprot:c18014_g1_i4 orf=228-476(+)